MNIKIILLIIVISILSSCVSSDNPTMYPVKLNQITEVNGYFVEYKDLQRLKNGDAVKCTYFDRGDTVNKDGYLLPTNMVYTDGYGSMILRK